MPVHVVGACNSPTDAGIWENITPAQLNSSAWCVPYHTGCTGTNATYGAHTIAIDPNNSGTLYLGTSALGFWKTTDCGSTWTKIDTGANHDAIDQGRNWTISIDPTDSNVIYTTAGYGQNNVYKSTNGGVDFTPMLTANVIAVAPPSNAFVEAISMDPTNHLHLTATMHGPCVNNPDGGGNWACMAETRNGGTTWTLTNSGQQWSEGDGQTMINDQTWFYGSIFGGVWRTTNGGATWQEVYVGNAGGHVYTASDHTYYIGGGGVLHSTDGIHWAPGGGNAPSGSSVNGSNDIVDDGTNLYSAGGAYGGNEPAAGWYAKAPLSNPSAWTPAFNPVPMINGGSTLIYDPDHRFLYSANLTAGLWRVELP